MTYAFEVFWPKIYLVDEEEDMINFGLVAPEPNPFVNTGLPKPGQVWSLKKVPNCLVQITGYSSFGHGQVTYTMLNSQLDPRHRTRRELDFLENYSFSH